MGSWERAQPLPGHHHGADRGPATTRVPIILGLFSLLDQGPSGPALYTLVIAGSLPAVLPLIPLFLLIQRFWGLDLLSGVVKS
jgi:multiple sugar transport system permease protein